MAGDWIKMRTALLADPAVIGIAAALDMDEFAVVGRLHALWSWADQHTTDGNAVSVTEKWIDRYVSATGFAQALVTVGWLELTERGAQIPNFEAHNGESGKRRALTAKRAAKHRTVKSNATSVTKSAPREEKRREEIKGEYPLNNPPNGDTVSAIEAEAVVACWNATPGVRPIRTMNDKRKAALRVRCRDPSWDWRAALAKFPLKCFSSGGGWVPDLDWFLKTDTVNRILEGNYDWTKDDERRKPNNAIRVGPGQRFDPDAGQRDPNFGVL